MEREFQAGQQPCKDFRPEELSPFGVQTHECWCGHAKGLHCEGSVAFCANCYTDHHSGGYQTCICGGKGFIR
jgi:hypothetical protein